MDLTARKPTLHPAKFIVRDDTIDQEKGYPGKCALVTKILIKKAPPSINAFLEELVAAHEELHLRKYTSLPREKSPFFELKRHIDDSNWQELLDDPKKHPSVPWVNRPSTHTPIAENATGKKLMTQIRNKTKAKHRWSFAGMTDLFKKPRDRDDVGDYTHFTAPLNGHDVPFGTALTFRKDHHKQHEKIYHPANMDAITHDGKTVDLKKSVFDYKPGDAAYEHEHRWALIAQNYATAMDEEKSNPERVNAAINCYWMVSQDCPFLRGSATFSRILLECLSHHVGFEVPPTKPGEDLNYNALLTDLPVFKKSFKKGKFFDTKTPPDAIFAWHEAQLQSYQAPAP